MPLWLWWQLYLDEKEFQFLGGRGENVQVLGPQRRWGDIIHWAAGIYIQVGVWVQFWPLTNTFARPTSDMTGHTLCQMSIFIITNCYKYFCSCCYFLLLHFQITSVSCQQERPEAQWGGDECYLCHRRRRSERRNWSAGVQENDAPDLLWCCVKVQISS